MQSLNNLDFVILIVVAVSALIAWSRGLVKEVLSIIGWVLATMAVIYLLPVVMPFAKEYIASGMVAGICAALSIMILFFVVWIYATSGIVGKIRTSKLNGMDRLLGLFFGIVRAFLLVVLFNILVSWMIPVDRQSEVLTESKYFRLAGRFAQPIEELIPAETVQLIKERAQAANQDSEQNEKARDSDADELFEKLAQPRIKKSAAKVEIKENFKGYRESERDNLDRLIENVE